MTVLEAARLDPPGEETGAKWGAQVTLPASSRSLQPSADTQPQAGGGVRGREGKAEARLPLSSSSGTSAGGARGRFWDSPGEGRTLRASSAATHGSGQPSWETPSPGKGEAKIWVADGPPLRIPQPASGAPPSALASGARTATVPRRPGAHSPSQFSRVPGRQTG